MGRFGSSLEICCRGQKNRRTIYDRQHGRRNKKSTWLMKRLLMISGGGAADTARGKRNAFYYTLEELKKYFDIIEVVYPGRPVPGGHFDVMTVQEYFPFSNGRMAEKIWRKTGIPYILEIHHDIEM